MEYNGFKCFLSANKNLINMSKKKTLFDLTWVYPRSFVDRYYHDSKVYIRWGYVLTFFPLLGLMPFAFLVLDGDIAKPFALAHACLAVVIASLLLLTYRSNNGVLVNYLTFAVFVAGGTSLNAAAFLNSNPPVIYTVVGHFECMLLLFVAVRVPWVSTILYGLLVIAVYVYIVVDVWAIQSLDAIIISVALVFVLFLVSVGCYARDKQAFELYGVQDSMKALEEERIFWSITFTRFLKHELSNQIAALSIYLYTLSRQGMQDPNRYLERGMQAVEELKELVTRAADAVSIDEVINNSAFEFVDIIGIMGDLELEFQEITQRKTGIKVNNFCGKEKYLVNGDHLLIKQMMRNIIHNAVRHSSVGSMVEVEFSRSGSMEVINEGDTLSNDIESLFDIGFTGGSDKPGSYGLGLYLARKIAVAHGWEISARPLDRAPGAVFTILFSPAEASE